MSDTGAPHHFHTKVVYKECSCYFIECSTPGSCADPQSLATGQLHTGDTIFECELCSTCPTCSRVPLERVGYATGMDSRSDFDSESSSDSDDSLSVDDGETYELVEDSTGEDEIQEFSLSEFVDTYVNDNALLIAFHTVLANDGDDEFFELASESGEDEE